MKILTLLLQYAIMNFMGMLGKASLFLDWDHKVTPLSEEIKVFATIFPQDDCYLTFKERIPLVKPTSA